MCATSEEKLQLMLHKRGSYPRPNGLAVALRELGRIERTLFVLSWLQSVDLRRRVHAGLNKGEARDALARAVFLCRLGEIRRQLRTAALSDQRPRHCYRRYRTVKHRLYRYTDHRLNAQRRSARA